MDQMDHNTTPVILILRTMLFLKLHFSYLDFSATFIGGSGAGDGYL